MEQKPLRVLCISFWTPPVVRPQAILLGKMLPEWERQGISPVLLSIAQKEKWEGVSFPQYYIPAIPGLVSRIVGRVPLLREWSDSLYQWYWARVAEKIIKDEKIDLIFSFANPQESNILGAILHKKLKLPFISHFSDPWYDNHYKDFTPERGALVLKLEKFIMEESDLILFTNQPALEMVMKKYPKEWIARTAVIPHNYEAIDYPERTKPRPTKPPYKISYIGAFYQKRTPEPFFKALAALLKKHPELEDAFTIELIGAANPYAGYSIEQLEQMLSDYGLRERATLTAPITYKESLRAMVESDLLIAIDADIPGSPYLPSKVIDYIGSGTPIVSITPTGSPAGKIVTGSGYWTFSYEETDKLAAFLERWLKGDEHPKRDQKYIDQFTIASTSAMLIAHFNSVNYHDYHDSNA